MFLAFYPTFLLYRRLASKGDVVGEGPGDNETFFISNRTVSQENLYEKGKNEFVNWKNKLWGPKTNFIIYKSNFNLYTWKNNINQFIITLQGGL